MDRIAKALMKLFEQHRVIFWYDEKKELRQDFEGLNLQNFSNLEKIELKNNQFSLKYRILREQPESKFLLYHEGPAPSNLNNWLLDIQLANAEFKTDQEAILLSELGLGPEFSPLIQSHLNFFKATKRCEELKSLLNKEDTSGKIRLKMLAVCVSSDASFDAILESLLAEDAEKKEEKIKLLTRCALDNFLWDQLKRYYGYDSKSPSLKDFLIELFKSCYAMETDDGEIRLANSALSFLKRWKDSRQHEASFEALSTECAEYLNIEEHLKQQDYQKLLTIDYFRLIDQKILVELVKNVVDRTISSGACTIMVQQRKQSHWYQEFSDLYQAVKYGAEFIHTLEKANLIIESIKDGVQKYIQSWFKIDQLYRNFIFHVKNSRQISLMQRLIEKVENLYSNSYLLKLNDNWQTFIDKMDQWEVPSILLQNRFFEKQVHPFLKKEKKIFVIISDALRYEIGEELLSLIRQEDRFEANLIPALSMLPSYTQLGMAALLPNKELEIKPDATVLIDKKSSMGIENRSKVLKELNGVALKSDELMNMNSEECREVIKSHSIIYIYHNRIDQTGDKKESEERVFEAVQETLNELIKIIKKLTSANANNLLLTADHGFIFQNAVLEKSDFTEVKASGKEILFKDRRFIIGKELKENPSLRKFTSKNLGLKGELEIQIPKSINRLRLRGSGSRFVHGGASLQEVIIPVLQINKKRQSDITMVEVDILKGETSLITSGQMTVAFYQVQPISDKVQKRTLRAGLYSQKNQLISDCPELTFDLTSDNPRERELPVRFLLKQESDQVNNQEVILKLEECVPGTSHYQAYKSEKYTMRRSFTSDFDF